MLIGHDRSRQNLVECPSRCRRSLKLDCSITRPGHEWRDGGCWGWRRRWVHAIDGSVDRFESRSSARVCRNRFFQSPSPAGIYDVNAWQQMALKCPLHAQSPVYIQPVAHSALYNQAVPRLCYLVLPWVHLCSKSAEHDDHFSEELLINAAGQNSAPECYSH